jgi:hypothetical protein
LREGVLVCLGVPACRCFAALRRSGETGNERVPARYPPEGAARWSQLFGVVLACPGRDASAVRFSRHAKNEMRLYKITPIDVSAVVADPAAAVGEDVRGNRRLTGPDANGRAIIVVVAGDDPDFVITTFPDD